MAVFNNRVMCRRRWFLRLTILSVALSLIVGVVLMHALQISAMAAVQSSINSYKPLLTGLRLVVIGLIAYAWPKLIQYGHQSGRISERHRTWLSSLRWRTVGWMLIIELVLGQNLVGQLNTVLDWTGT
jgi:hypothetical protein